MSNLTPETLKRLEQILGDKLQGAEVIASSVFVSEGGEVSVDELVLKVGPSETWSIIMDSQEERVVLSRYNGPGNWYRFGPNQVLRSGDWQEVTAQDLTEEDL